RVPGGDHWVVMGAVQKVTLTEGAPLVYFRGGYRALREA
ncbi:MAG: flavin reductase family protein, partial [Gammaproteobacteria bacterium]|nr:flavin reductase family protein [Gammaproteobacteria bacterium]